MKKLVRIVSTLFLGFSLSGCMNVEEQKNIVNISILNSKPEIQSILEEAVREFEEENSDIRVKIVKYNQSQAYQDKMVSMQQYGNTPTILVIDPTHIGYVEDDVISLEEEPWVQNISIELSDAAKNKQGELIAFPFAVEGIGFIYNKSVLDAAGVDPEQINDLSSLEEAFKKVEASGKGALIIANEDWSLANHFLPIAYSLQGERGSENASFIEGLQSGEVDLVTNEAVNGLLDTLDVMKKYNIYKDAPLVHINSKCAELMGKGEIGFYYMGNWVSTEIAANDPKNGDYGFVPVPVSLNSNDYGNNEITAAIKYLVIDGKNNSPEQQEAAKRFVNWLVFEEAGQDFIVNKASLIPGVDNNPIETQNDFMNSIIDYQQEGKVIELNNATLPDKNTEVIGDYLRKYLNDEIDRVTLLTQIVEHWKK